MAAWPADLYAQEYDSGDGNYGDGDYDDGGDWDIGHGWDHGDHEWESDGGWSEAPGLSCMDVLGELATETQRDPGEFGEGSYGDEGDGLSAAGFVDSAIEVLRDLSDAFVDAIDALTDSLYACVDASAEVGSVGYCVALNGNTYSTLGGGVSLPVGVQIGVSNNADAFIEGWAITVNPGISEIPGIGMGVGFNADAYAVSIGTMSYSYSEGTYVGNVWDSAAQEMRNALDAGAQALQSIERQLYDMSQDPFVGEWR